MKLSVHFSRVMLTTNKKNYAGMMLSKEGNVLDKTKFEIKGLPIKKSTTPKFARKFFSDILEKDILLKDEISPKEIYYKFKAFESMIRDSVYKGETKLLKPSVIKNVANYSLPYRLAQYTGFLHWNTLYPDQEITQFSALKLLPIREGLTEEEIEEALGSDAIAKLKAMREEHSWENRVEAEGLSPDMEDAKSIQGIKDANPLLFSVIALPFEMDTIPEELRSLINYDKIINDAIRNGVILLESVGFNLIKTTKATVASNLITF